MKPKKASPNPVDAVKAKQTALLSQARQEMSKVNFAIDSSIKSDLAATTTPLAIDSLHIDTLTFDSSESLSIKELAYRDELAVRLKLLLKLPEYGEIKLKLTVDRSGQVTAVKILSAESSANKKYIEKTLPKLKMPPFGNNFGSASTNVFTITMSNE